MKKKLFFKTCKFHFVLFILLITLLTQAKASTGKTFLMPRPIGQDLAMQTATSRCFIDRESKTKEKAKASLRNKNNAIKQLFRKINNNSQKKHLILICNRRAIKNPRDFYIASSLFYKESTNSSKLAKFFFPNNKTELLVKGRNVTGDRDIASEWLSIKKFSDIEPEKNFSSKISIHPEERSFGVNLQLLKNLNCISNKLQFALTLPFMQIETDTNLNEYDIQNAPNPNPSEAHYLNAENAADYFNHPFLRYSKIKNGTLTQTGLADINLKLNYYLKNKSSLTMSLYPQLIIPTSHRPKTEYLFEPIVGNAGHWGLGAGANFDFEICKKNNNILNAIGIIDYSYLFESTEKRTFDLKNCPWSRYLLLIDGSIQKMPINGVNILTKNLKVSPESTFNALLALHYKCKWLNLELGYNFWWKAKENVKLKNAWSENVGIAHLDNDGKFIEKATNSNATIATIPQTATKDSSFTKITAEDLNLESAAHPSTNTNKIYIASGFGGKYRENVYQACLGLAYEFVSSNNAIPGWTLWLQLNFAI